MNVSRAAIQHHQGNLKILDDYWQAEYMDRDITAPKEAFRRLLRAVEAVGHYSLINASKQELQTEIDSKFSGNKQRKIVSALNQILSYLKSDIKLRKAREELRPVTFMTEAELKTLTSTIDKPLSLIIQVAFATGLRVGEIFAISPEHVKAKHIYVADQIDRSHKRRETKTRRVRDAFILSNYRSAVSEWARFPDKMKYRDLIFSRIMRKLTKKLLGRSLNFHALRHSYAVHLIDHGVSVAQTARCLGNSAIVCEKYYSGFVATPETIASIETKLAKE